MSRAKEIVAQMTLEEKAEMCAGKNFWYVKGVEKCGIRPVMVTDGPHGLRKQAGEADMLGLNASVPAIAFPAGCAQASSFDPEVAEQVGEQLGKICQAEDVSVILGPAMNIKRSPLCGRNFEYYSEDPLVSTKMGCGMVRGVQSQHVGTSPKHYLANSQETYRMTVNSVVDERTLREIYLASFEGMVKNAKPWTVMCSYNKVNGTYSSENHFALTEVLRDEWGFDGYVMTDWGALADPVKSIEAGLDLAMPGPNKDAVDTIIRAVKEGRLDESVVTQAAERIIDVNLRYLENHKDGVKYDYEAGHEAAHKAACESAVLLKNDDAILPIAEGEKVLIAGPFAKKPRYQGGGSSHIHPYHVTGAWETLGKFPGMTYADAFSDEKDADNAALIAQAVEAAKAADKVVIFAGLPESFESEGYDRKHMDLPAYQNEAIAAIAAVNPNVIVVLHNGAPVAMPWIGSVKAVVEMYLGGEAVGEAAADLLTGAANPSGHLPETFPIRIEDTPTYPSFGLERHDVPYREGVLVGYRWYETRKAPVLFPFGTGLSYTTFDFSDLRVSASDMKDTDTVDVTVKVTNTGSRDGKALVQLYIAAKNVADDVLRPVRELRAFQKVALAAGESKDVTLTLNKRAFAYWNTEVHDWVAASGDYTIEIGRDASDIVLCQDIHVNCTNAPKFVVTRNTALGDLLNNAAAMKVMQGVMQAMGAQNSDAGNSGDSDDAAMTGEAAQETGKAMPLRALLSFTDQLTGEMLDGLIAKINEGIQNQ